MKEREQFQIKIGELKVGRSPDLLKATLGSCVGIAIIWKEKGLFGLAHCLLPEEPKQTFQIGAKYVDQAVPSLLSMMRLKPENYDKVEVFLAGGGNMMDALAAKGNHVGLQNSESAKRVLSRYGLKITKTSLGGEKAHQISVDCATGEVEMLTIEREAK